MTRFLDRPLSRVASRLLRIAGADLTYRRQSAAAYNTTTGASTQTATDTAIRGLVSAYSLRDRQADPLIADGDRRVLIAAADLAAAPNTGDQILAGSRTLSIVGQPQLIQATDDVVLYELRVRGSG